MSWVMEPAWGAKVGRVFLFGSLRGVEGWLRMGCKEGWGLFVGLPSGAEEDEACPSMCAKTFNEPKTRGQTPFRREA